MLGEKIGELKGKVISRRVLSVEGGKPKLETTIRIEGQLLGASFKGNMTYQGEPQPSGGLYGHGQGVMMDDSGEVVTIIGFGAARPNPGDKKIGWRGCNFFQTSSSKYSNLNGLAVVFQHDEDSDGNITNEMWEWR